MSDQVRTVVIDAGHGGKDPGNLGTRRYKKSEKDVSLSVALKVEQYIKQRFPGVKVVMTRRDDSYPTLHERTSSPTVPRATYLSRFTATPPKTARPMARRPTSWVRITTTKTGSPCARIP